MKSSEAETVARSPSANGSPRRAGTYLFVNEEQVHVPGWVVDIDSFRRWTDTDEFPDHGHVWWLHGEVWADMSKEQLFTHLMVKAEFFRVLGNLAATDCPGGLIPDGLLLSNFAADISGNPDATYISKATADSDRVRLIEGARRGIVEIQGTPDMVLEVVSDSSVRKDLETLMRAYWKAEIPEYWLIDARGEELRFEIWKHGPSKYRRAANRNGWIASGVFGKSFNLTSKTSSTGWVSYLLEVR